MTKCPYCGRKTVEDELYCYFCDQEIKELNKLDKKKDLSSLSELKVEPKVVKKQTFIGYCVKCRKKVYAENPRGHVMKNNAVALKGNCPFCTTSVFRITKGPTKQQKQKTFPAYCVKCKKKVDAVNPKEHTMKNGTFALKGNCPKCSTKVFRIVAKKPENIKNEKKRLAGLTS